MYLIYALSCVLNLIYALIYILLSKRILNHRNLLYVVSAFNGFFLLFWPLDYGPVVVLIFNLFFYLNVYSKKISNLIKVFILSIFSVLAFSLIFTKGHIFNVLKFNYFELRKYQYWYFAPFDLDNINLLRLLIDFEKLFFPIFLFIILYFLLKNYHYKKLYLFIGLTFFTTGLLSTVLGHPSNYFYFFKFFVITVSFLFIFKYFEQSINIIFYISIVLLSYQVSLDSNESNYKDLLYSEKLGGYIEYDLFSLTNLDSDYVYEEYFGIYGSANAENAFSKVDSIIHTYDTERLVVIDKLKMFPFTVITNKNHGHYQWNLSFNWWFYETLFLEYEPNLLNEEIVIWNKKENATGNLHSWSSCVIKDEEIYFNSKSVQGLYSVEISKNRLNNLIKVYNNFSIPGKLKNTNFTYLNPNKVVSKFPVILDNNTRSISISGDFLKEIECRYKFVLSRENPVFNNLELNYIQNN